MTLSLRNRLLVSHAVLVVVVLAVVTAALGVEQARWIRESHALQLERRAVETERQLRGGAIDASDPERAAQTLSDLLGVRVTLIDSSGTVHGDSEVPRERLAEVENHAGRSEVRAALGGRIGHASRTSATVGKPYAYVAVPARLPGIA